MNPPPPPPSIATMTSRVSVGELRPMPFSIACLVCGRSRRVWPSLVDGWVRGHEECALRVVSVGVAVPVGMTVEAASECWNAALAERGWTALAEPAFHNAGLHAEMGLDFLIITGDALMPPTDGGS